MPDIQEDELDLEDLFDRIRGTCSDCEHPGCHRTVSAASKAIRQYAAMQTAKALDNGVGVIYGIANDLACRDRGAVGSVSTAPYFANAVAIYSEFLKGDNYERIDWKALKLPTLERIKQLKKGQK